jgi:hypothetical protein
MKDFFISYTKADRAWAEWIAWQLEDLGYETVIDVRDFSVGSNFILEMHKGVTAQRTIAILSPEYMDAAYTPPEWAAAIADDPKGENRKLIPIKVKPVQITGLLKPILHIDLVGLSENEAKNLLQDKIKASVNGSKPSSSTKPDFPPKISVTNKRLTITQYQLGLLDRIPQSDHFINHVPAERCLNNGQTKGFIVSGPYQESPDYVRFKLAHVLKEDLLRRKHSPILTLLGGEKSLMRKEPAQFLWELLADGMGCKTDEVNQEIVRTALEKLTECHIFFRRLSNEEAKNHKFLTGMLSAWSEIALNCCSPSHFLLLIRDVEHNEIPKPSRLLFFKRPLVWRQQMELFLKERGLKESLLPELNTPAITDIRDWLKYHVPESLRDDIEEVLKNEFTKSSGIPHGDLKKILRQFL